MAQSGYTPISLYYTTTAAAVPTSGNLVNGELAINITDGKLYYKNNSGVVTLLAGATSGPAGGSNTQVQFNSSGALAGSANLTFNGTTLTANTIGAFTLGGTVAGGGNNINNVVIGAGGALAGNFTTLSATGNVTIAPASGVARLDLNAGGGSAIYLDDTSANGQWLLGANNYAAQFEVYNVDRASLDFKIANATGLATFANSLAVTGTLSATSSGSFTQPSSTNTGLTVKSFSAAGGNQPLGVFQRSDAAVSIELGYDGGTGNCHIGTTTAHDFEIWRGGSVKATASSTGLAVTGTLTSTLDATIYGVTVGRGGGAVATNTAVGASALAANTSGTNSVGIGFGALLTNTSGTQNIAIGRNALNVNLTTSDNTGIGHASLQYSTGSSNTAVGSLSLASNTTASNNTAVGYQAGYNNTTATDNAYFGYLAGYSSTTNGGNTGIGNLSLQDNTGYQNTALGSQALLNNTSGFNNTGLGKDALASNTTASNNTAVGYQAGYAATAGTSTFLGTLAGYTATSGTSNIFIGYNSIPSAATDTGTLVIGVNATGKGSNTGFIVANGSIYQGNNLTLWAVTSDQRLKKNIVENNIGLDIINQIQVRNFEYRLPEEVDAALKPSDAIQKEGVQLGVIAQELQAVLPDCVKTESTGVMSVNSDALMWHMINAIKELSAKVTALEAK